MKSRLENSKWATPRLLTDGGTAAGADRPGAAGGHAQRGGLPGERVRGRRGALPGPARAAGAAGGGGRGQFEVETLLNLQLFFILLIRLFLKFLDLFGYFLLLRDLRLPSG